MANRRSGILLHPSSLPGRNKVGKLGQEAFHFIDFLVTTKQKIWQVLPLGPTHADRSPYQTLSVHAGDPLLISWGRIKEKGWLPENESTVLPKDFGTAMRRCEELAEHAMAQFQKQASDVEKQAHQQFLQQHRWLQDYALYIVIKSKYQQAPWYDWPKALRDRDVRGMAEFAEANRQAIDDQVFLQFLFFSQWLDIKHYANERGISLFGDMPIFVAHDSAEVWAYRDCFALDETGHCEVVAGVPPDYFSATGQRWGNPHYDWDRMTKDNYAWWRERFKTQMEMFDSLRIDHFRGFDAYWEIPAEENTAINGRWVQGPGKEFFDNLSSDLGDYELVAEDLGVITDEVIALRDALHLPGMKILHFAFDGNAHNPYLPHNHTPCSVVYTGTHDNNTTLGWYKSLNQHDRARIKDYLAESSEPMPWALIRVAQSSVAEIAVVPMQDILSLGEEARMNTPGTTEGNWTWRFQWDQVGGEIAQKLRHLTELYGRAD